MDPAASPLLDELFRKAGLADMAERILKAALGLFARKGYAATSVREIVQEAGATNPMLYYYFGNKEGVFNHLIRLFSEGMLQDIHEAMARPEPLRQRVCSIFAHHMLACQQAPMVLQFFLSAMFGPLQSRPDFDFLAHHQRMIGPIVAIFEEAIARGEFLPREGWTPERLAEELMGLITFHSMRTLKITEALARGGQVAHLFDEFASPEAVERMADFFLRGTGTIQETPS